MKENLTKKALSFVFCLGLLILILLSNNFIAEKEKEENIGEDPIVIIVDNQEEINKLKKEIEELEKENKNLLIANENYEKLNSFTLEEWRLLGQIVQCEAGYESIEGQKNVCYVIFNRLNSIDFPNTLEEVISQSGQFSPYESGIYKNKIVTNFTWINIQQAWIDWDPTAAQGCLYFNKNKQNAVFIDEIGHCFR